MFLIMPGFLSDERLDCCVIRAVRGHVPSRALAVALVVLLPTSPSFAQEGTASLAGRILDDTDRTPLSFATVLVTNAGGEPLSGVLAGSDGRFVVRGLAPGSYKIEVSFPGFYALGVAVLVSELNDSYDLGDVRLLREVNLEQDITVTAEQIRGVGVHTEVFRIDEGPTQSTGSLLDAMRNLPGVTVDQEGRVSLRGSYQVSILINGRQSSLTGFGSQRGLDGVSAANVEAIEIIHNPSASLDAAGMAGVINIIYKREQAKGLSGDVGLSVGVGQLSKRRSDLPTDLGSYSNNPKFIPSVNLNYNTEDVRSFFQAENRGSTRPSEQ